MIHPDTELRTVGPHGLGVVATRPVPRGTITWARGSLKSAYGLIESSWRIENGSFALDVTIPPNTSATVTLPNGKTHEVGAGSHHFGA